MNEVSDEVIKQICVYSNENQMKLLCSTNKRILKYFISCGVKIPNLDDEIISARR